MRESDNVNYLLFFYFVRVRWARWAPSLSSHTHGEREFSGDLFSFRVAKCVQQMQRPDDDRAVPIRCYIKTHSSIRFDWAISGAVAKIRLRNNRSEKASTTCCQLRAQMKRIYRKIGCLVHLQRHSRFDLAILCAPTYFCCLFFFCRVSTILFLLSVLRMTFCCLKDREWNNNNNGSFSNCCCWFIYYVSSIVCRNSAH